VCAPELYLCMVWARGSHLQHLAAARPIFVRAVCILDEIVFLTEVCVCVGARSCIIGLSCCTSLSTVTGILYY